MIGSVESKATFSAFRSAGVRVRCGPLQMVFTQVESTAANSPVQLAFAINKRFGNAVQRNRARRRMRASFTQVCCEFGELPPGSAFLLMARSSVLQQPFSDLLDCTKSCFDALETKGAFG